MAWRFATQRTYGLAPSPRSNFASAVYGNEFFVAGGTGGVAHSDAFALDLHSLRWRKLGLGTHAETPESAIGGALAKRKGVSLGGRASFAHASRGRVLYIHGGVLLADSRVCFPGLLALDMDASTLVKVKSGGDGPVCLSRHVLVALGDSLYTTLGMDREGEFQDKTWRLRLSDEPGGASRWEELETSGWKPWKRHGGCMIAMPQPSPHLLLFGGGDGVDDFDDLYSLDTSHAGTVAKPMIWERIANISGEEKRNQAACMVLPPSAGAAWRAQDGAHAFGVFGGHGGDPHWRGDALHPRETMLVLPFGGPGGPPGWRPVADGDNPKADGHGEPWRFTAMRTSGAWPVARMGHAAVLVNDSMLVVFGGTSAGDVYRDDASGKRDDVVFGYPNKHRPRPAAPAPSPPPLPKDAEPAGRLRRGDEMHTFHDKLRLDARKQQDAGAGAEGERLAQPTQLKVNEPGWVDADELPTAKPASTFATKSYPPDTSSADQARARARAKKKKAKKKRRRKAALKEEV